ncbi:MAG: thiamine phosphate synthase [Candidatus Eisenbacteria sp.]|nr:thiamine phosphate synthase [Candidatus Eisenbacteria bacterium]
MPSFDNWSLYAITPDDVECEVMLDMVAQALESGITAVQVRRKQVTSRQLFLETRRVLELAGPLGVPVIVNDRLDIALAAGADGVHLGQDDLPLGNARAIAAPGFLMGVSVHNADEAREAEAQKASYVAVGPIYASRSKATGPAGGTELVRSVRRIARGPLIAIGGIGPEKVGEVLEAGADGVAVISGIYSGGSVRARVGEFREAIARAKS